MLLSWGCARRKEEEYRGSVNIPVVILFAAYNEEKVVRSRLENLIQVGSRDSGVKSQILVGIDCSTDKTAEVAHEFAAAHENIHVVEFKQRRGKVAVLKDLVRKSREDINRRLTQINSGENSDYLLVFTDANTMFKQEAIGKLLAHFSNPRVGGVCGRLEFRENEEAGNQKSGSEGFYWRWETQLKVMESRLDSCLGANGAIYAVRSNLFSDDVPENTIVDDFVIGMKVREQGFRMLYEPDAVAEEAFPEQKYEWNRRVRIGAGDFQALVLCRRCLLPQYGVFAWQFWSHKVLRWLTPHAVLFLVASSLFIVVEEGFCPASYLSLAVLVGTMVFVLFSGIGKMIGPAVDNFVGRSFRMCNYFLTMNMALLAGSVRFLWGDLKGYWDRTPRG